MTELALELQNSPSREGNFIIPYDREVDELEDNNIKPEQLFEYIQNNSRDLISNADPAYFPRAFTDLDLADIGAVNEDNTSDVNNITSKPDFIVKHEIKLDFDGDLDAEQVEESSRIEVMEGRNSGKNFQPDVIMSNSNQRIGPDGSPALVPSQSRGFVPAANLSETGELFAPVRTLTFSDIDQSSHIEDSFANSSRLVSTPTRSNRGQTTGYDYNSIPNLATQPGEHVLGIGQPQFDDSDSDDRNSREESPEFRQLDGEAASDLTGTGAFNPSAMGINKEFLDHFTGKNSMNIGGDVFSPLGSGGYGGAYHHQQQRRTPPLHSPAPNSPYAKRFGNQSSNQYVSNDNMMQFTLSPTKTSNQPDFLSNSNERVCTGAASYQSNISSQNRQDYMNNDRFYPNEHMFEPIEKQPQVAVTNKNIPRNLEDYVEQGYTNNQPADNTAFHQQVVMDSANRQGDGYDPGYGHDQSDLNDRQRHSSDFDKQFSAVSPSVFEQRYLQKTKVSVKLPQAMYDTMTSEFSQEDRVGDTGADQARYSPTGPDQARYSPTGLPPDSLEEEDMAKFLRKRSPKPSPEKVVDLIQTQVTNLKQVSRTDAVNIGVNNSNGSGDGENVSDMEAESQGAGSRYRNESKTNQNMSLKSKDSGPYDSSHGSLKQLNDTNRNTDNNSEPRSEPSSNENSLANAATNQSRAQFSESMLAKTSTQNSSAKVPVSQNAQSFQAASQPQTSSRLLQETLSKKNKTSQKFTSNAPAVSKSTTNQNTKEFKKPYDVVQKTSNSSSTSNGARKVLNDSDNNSKTKVNDRVNAKSKTGFSESFIQRNINNVNQSKNGSRSEENLAKSAVNQSASQGQPRGQGQMRCEGQGHNESLEDGERGPGRVITQVETTSPVPIDNPDPVVRPPAKNVESSLDIQGMEEVRHQLQGMLRLSHGHMSPQERSRYEHSDIVAGFGMEMAEPHRQTDMSWNMTRNPVEDNLSEKFPSFSSQLNMTDSGNVTSMSRSDVSLHAENQRLRDMLEKERYRRKHCEQYIQQLNVKLLETQQQVAVAVSTDKRKDIMIDQLDKQLAKVVEGWKKRDEDKDGMIDDVKKEKEAIENNMKQQQQMIGQFEHDMSQAVEALRQEKENSEQDLNMMREKLDDSERGKGHMEEMLSAEQEKVQLHVQECDNLRESRETLDKKLDQMQRRLHREQDDWFQREQELLLRIEEVAEKNTKILHIERVKNEEQGKLAEEIMDQYQTACTRVKKLEMDLDTAVREKESVKVEMSIMEAKFENAHRVLEADMHSQMEKQIAEQIADVQARSEKVQDGMREKHRDQVLELNQRHGRDMETQLGVFREEIIKKEEDARRQLHELEARLVEYRTENSELKLSKQKLESNRLEILTKLQYAMQSQWNEALSLLSATPQRKRLDQSASTTTTLSDSTANETAQSVSHVPTVNFNLLSPCKTATNQNSTDNYRSDSASQRTAQFPTANHSSPDRTESTNQRGAHILANQDSPQIALANHNGGNESYMSHSTEKDPTEQREEDLAIETTALSHLKQFQDYMNSLTQTPEWISSITSHTDPDQHGATNRASPVLPHPTDLAALLSTHLNNIQQQQLIPHPHLPSSQSAGFISHPHPLLANQQSLVPVSSNHEPRASQPISNHSVNLKLANQISQKHKGQNLTPPRSSNSSVLSNQKGVSMSHVEINQSHGSAFHSAFSEAATGASWEGAHGMTQAVPIRPPQQSDDPYLHDDDDQSVISSIAGGQMGYNFQGGQSFSPPTKQNRTSHHHSTDDLTHQSSRLKDDYSDLSEKLEQHESHQNDLQHYIHILLNKSPRTPEQNDSMYSQDHEELDLNDTAQAAQIQQELDRIQVLRQKQEASSKSRDPANKPAHDALSTNTSTLSVHGQDQKRILSPDQLADITRLLNDVKSQSQPNNPQVMELLDLLKHAQAGKGLSQGSQDLRRPHKHSPRVPGQSQGDKHKGLVAGKRNVQFNPSKVNDSSRASTESNRQDKTVPPKSAQPKKMERKVAGSATKGEKGGKVWK